MGRGVNTGALSPVGGIGEIRMRANLRKIVAYKDFAKQMVMAQYITSWLSFGNRKAIIGAAEMRKCLDKIFDLAINERLK